MLWGHSWPLIHAWVVGILSRRAIWLADKNGDFWVPLVLLTGLRSGQGRRGECVWNTFTQTQTYIYTLTQTCCCFWYWLPYIIFEVFILVFEAYLSTEACMNQPVFRWVLTLSSLLSFLLVGTYFSMNFKECLAASIVSLTFCKSLNHPKHLFHFL